ncbi:hypothetical protein [Raoultibacter phocaeensis]|uniref:hypothetical protein n=1 Tax=Raoultibacter phocaeensis TaxID=2479841 RepID=UPI00111B309C|nr:hypothetical protein [Raoultibacter phocaeensis]
MGSAHYFKNEPTRTEIDFVIDGNRLDPNAIPVEVKYGTNLKAKSLTAYVKKYGPDVALRVSATSHAYGGSIEDVPFYAFGSYMRKNITGAV